MEQEEWKDIFDFTNYEISSQGRIRNKRGMVLSTCSEPSGYIQAKLCRNGKVTSKRIHVLVAHAFLGQRPHKFDICHQDGDKKNNRLDNLRYDTRKANIHDCIAHKTRPIGTRHGRAKLSELQVKLIRSISGLGITNTQLSNLFRISNANISLILNRKIWNHI